MPKVTAFRPGLEFCVNSVGPGLRHDIRNPAARSRYSISSDYFLPFWGHSLKSSQVFPVLF